MKNSIGLMKGVLGAKIMAFVALRPKKFCFLIDVNDENKNAKRNCVIKQKFQLED